MKQKLKAATGCLLIAIVETVIIVSMYYSSPELAIRLILTFGLAGLLIIGANYLFENIDE